MGGGGDEEGCDAMLRGKTKGVMMGRRSLHFEPTLRPSARRTAEAHDGERKGVAEGFIVSAHEVRWCDLELLLWKSVVVADNEDDGGDDEVGLDDRLDPVETIRYFPMANTPLSFFDTTRFAHSHRLLS